MSEENTSVAAKCICEYSGEARLCREFHHLRKEWCWLFLFGLLLMVCGAAAVIFPALTVVTSVTAVLVLGVALIIAGLATIIAGFWEGKWSGLLLQLFVGILYAAVGLMIIDWPVEKSTMTLTLLLAAFFVVVGAFRTVASVVIRFPFWGWSLLNGLVTFLLGVIIYRLCHHAPWSSLWILGLLIGIEMFFHGWTWIALSLAIHHLPKEPKETCAV